MRPADVATLVGVDPYTVRRWIKRRELAAIKVGREWRVERSALDAFLDARRTAPAPVDTTPAAVTRAGR